MSLTLRLLKLFRAMPKFKGKLRIGKMLFKKMLDVDAPLKFRAHRNITYSIPNSIESLGIELLINGTYEERAVDFIFKQLKAGQNYFDIGANIGALALPVIKHKDAINYYGFEASPLVFPYLEDNFRDNGLSGYHLFNSLVHETQAGKHHFYQSKYYGKSSLAPTYTKEAIMVDSISLDGFCSANNIPVINFMKVDVQGFELYVFKGLKKMLECKAVENILFEFEYWAEEDAGLERGAAQKYIAGMGYELYNMAGKKMSTIITEGRAMIWARRPTSN